MMSWDVDGTRQVMYFPGIMRNSAKKLGYDIVTWMARTLLGNGPVNTPRPNTRKAVIEEWPFLCNDL
jgi:hypothetical protein